MRFFPIALQQSYRNEIETASPASRLINFKLRRYLTHVASVTSFEVFSGVVGLRAIARLYVRTAVRALFGRSGVRIPIYSGHLFRREAGRRYDLMSATIPE